MVLLTNGDSWTQGDSPSQTLNWKATKSLNWYDIVPNFGNIFTPIPNPPKADDNNLLYKFYDSDIWPKILGRGLGMETWNAGRMGTSNDNIVRTTLGSIDYLESIGKTDLFVVIGLTSLMRYETWNQVSFKTIHTNPNAGIGTWEDKRIHKNEWFRETTKLRKALIHRGCLNIINLQSFLKTRNIPYLIFNCFDHFFDTDIRLDSLFKYIDLDYIYNNDFKPHFKNHIEKKFNSNWGNDNKYFQTNHPTDISHIEWGNHLNEYIQSNYNIPTKSFNFFRSTKPFL